MSVNCVSFRGHGTESTGSIAKRNVPEETKDSTSVNFRGHGTESTGSIANTPTSTVCSGCGKPVNFRGGGYDTYESSNGSSLGKTVGTLAFLTLAGGLGLAYMHKAGGFAKLEKDWMKKTIGKLEPAGKKCHEWCSTAKTKGSEAWAKVKDKFGGKKS